MIPLEGGNGEPTEPPMGSSKLTPLARNAMLNLGTQVVLILVGLVCLPAIVHGLTAEEFGLLSVIWVFIGYFSLLDFGVSGAITKFLSELLARKEHAQAGRLVWTSLLLALILGVSSGTVIYFAIPFLMDHAFNIAPALRPLAARSLAIAACTVPVTVIFGILKGFQMALQRFDVVNGFQSVLGITQWVGSVLVLWLGFGLFEVVLLTLTVRVILVLASFSLLPRLFPGIYQYRALLERAAVRKLFSFGGWLTVIQVISPLQLFADRVIISTVLSLAWVTFFAVPMDALLRLVFIPMSVAGALYPHVSGHWTTASGKILSALHFDRSVKYTYVIMLPLLVLLIVYRQPLLRLWVGPEFVAKSAGVLAIVAVGLLLHSLSQIPSVFLQAVGKPDIAAKLLLVELPLYVGLCYLLTVSFGILGTALAWLARVTVETLVLFIGSLRRMPPLERPRSATYVWKAALFTGAGAVPLAILAAQSVGPAGLCVGAVLFALSYLAFLWFVVLDTTDRDMLANIKARFALRSSMLS